MKYSLVGNSASLLFHLLLDLDFEQRVKQRDRILNAEGKNKCCTVCIAG